MRQIHQNTIVVGVVQLLTSTQFVSNWGRQHRFGRGDDLHIYIEVIRPALWESHQTFHVPQRDWRYRFFRTAEEEWLCDQDSEKSEIYFYAKLIPTHN